MKFLRFSDICASGQAQGKRVFIRADLNVPQDDTGNITEDTRIRASLPAIQLALGAGAAVMVTSHLGRPTEGEFRPEDSLAPVAKRLGKMLGREVPLISNWVDGGFEVQPGQVVLLENCRLNKGEKKNNPELAAKLGQQGASAGHGRGFGDAVGGGFGAVGGSKVSTKLSILKTLATKVDQLIVGGGIANTFLLAAGKRIGESLAEPEMVREAQQVMDIMKERGAEVPLPVDVVVADEVSILARANRLSADEVGPHDRILDVGPKTSAKLADIIAHAGTIVWNGPVGVFEYPQFAGGTKMMASAIAHSEAFSIAGGGDTLAAIAKFDIANEVGYISTGGGAFLEVLEGRTLPAFEVLAKRAG